MKDIAYSLEEAFAKWSKYEGNRTIIKEGDTFFNWTVKYRTFSNRIDNHKTYFVCQCKCGRYMKICGDNLRRGTSKSCGYQECRNEIISFNQKNPDLRLLNKYIKEDNQEGYIIYKYVDNNKNIVYIGQTNNLQVRVQAHTQDNLKDFKGKIYYFHTDTKEKLNVFEFILINKYKPKMNIKSKYINLKMNMEEPEWNFYKEIK